MEFSWHNIKSQEDFLKYENPSCMNLVVTSDFYPTWESSILSGESLRGFQYKWIWIVV